MNHIIHLMTISFVFYYYCNLLQIKSPHCLLLCLRDYWMKLFLQCHLQLLQCLSQQELWQCLIDDQGSGNQNEVNLIYLNITWWQNLTNPVVKRITNIESAIRVDSYPYRIKKRSTITNSISIRSSSRARDSTNIGW